MMHYVSNNLDSDLTPDTRCLFRISDLFAENQMAIARMAHGFASGKTAYLGRCVIIGYKLDADWNILIHGVLEEF